MSSLISQSTSSSKLQLAATAAVSAAVAAGAILSYQRLQQDGRITRLKQSIPGPDNDDLALQKLTRHGPTPKPDKEDEHNQRLPRPEGLDKLRNAFIVIIGCGGVGSHAAAAFARSGVSKIRLVDFDQVTLSSLNRHAVATLADVGLPKVQCLQRRLVAITPWVRFDLRLEKCEGKSCPSLLAPWGGEGGRKPDFVIDAIDHIESKVELLKYCWDQGLPVIATDDGLSRAARRRLKLLGVTSGIPVVYSTEKMGEGKAALLPLADEEFQRGSVGDLGVLPDFRVRILPVLGTMPAVFGYTVANHVILKITGYPIDYAQGKGRDRMYDGILAFVRGTEQKMVRMTTENPAEASAGLKVPVTAGDIAFLVEELYKGRSVVTGIPTKLVLVRWKKPLGSTLVRIGDGKMEQKSSNIRLRDLVCMTKEEASRHIEEVLQGSKRLEDLYEPSIIEKVETRRKVAEAYERHR
ncbi:hypothetical protein B0T17DRAFT_542936 [Bombardia bombarda]|uniref:THIF-type NAD/FAD binding fold domain-containing protein n=1 Tax=Bombardia bombarda TaxID=252184 RepID=A0AA39W537_9PEZI|nr:hypothetical protein B0T17DRAFT_542936 [Bombardia bombarda]